MCVVGGGGKGPCSRSRMVLMWGKAWSTYDIERRPYCRDQTIKGSVVWGESEVGRGQVMKDLVNHVKNFARMWSYLGTVKMDVQPSSFTQQSCPLLYQQLSTYQWSVCHCSSATLLDGIPLQDSLSFSFSRPTRPSRVIGPAASSY